MEQPGLWKDSQRELLEQDNSNLCYFIFFFKIQISRDCHMVSFKKTNLLSISGKSFGFDGH